MTDAKDLHVFLRTKAKSETKAEVVKWEEKKNRWLENIEDLYKLISSWLEPLEKERVLSHSIEKTTVKEDPIGSYDVGVLTILIGNQKVEFYPKGTLIIGAEGRIDIKGQRAVRTIILNEGQWSVVERSPRLKTLPFNEDSFQDILSEVME